MNISRRQLLAQLSAASMIGKSGWSAAASLPPAPPRTIPWRNWSGGQTCQPAERLAPASEDAIADLIKKTSAQEIRPVGSSHSFSGLIPTSGKIISLNNLRGLLAHDPKTLQAEFWAGTLMSQMGDALYDVGQALPNMADVNYQTLAGAISTSTHGTGPKFGSNSSYISGMRLITANGNVLDLDEKHHADIFNAARVSLGSLGIITRVRLKNRKPFQLHEKKWFQKTDELLENIQQLITENDHFEFHSILHSNMSLAVATNETSSQIIKAKESTGDGDALGKLRMANNYLRNSPKIHKGLLNVLLKQMDFPDVIDRSYRVFSNVRDQRFNEMEYSVPSELGPACLREILKHINDNNLNSFFPVEYRYVKKDDIPLSMFQGGDRCSISVHQSYDMAYKAFFAEIEPIFWKYEGRPHWGKLHTLNAKKLSALYPHWKEFLAIRKQLDPTGKFLNPHLKSIFGVDYSSFTN